MPKKPKKSKKRKRQTVAQSLKELRAEVIHLENLVANLKQKHDATQRDWMMRVQILERACQLSENLLASTRVEVAKLRVDIVGDCT